MRLALHFSEIMALSKAEMKNGYADHQRLSRPTVLCQRVFLLEIVIIAGLAFFIFFEIFCGSLFADKRWQTVVLLVFR